MAILVDSNTRLLVQGITGRQGRYHTASMLKYGTKIVAGVTPGKRGERVENVPVYNNVQEAVENHPEINASIVFVPASTAADSIYEAIDAGIKLIVVITEGIPVNDLIKSIKYARYRGVRVIGPNCPGVISPAQAKVGIMPAHVFSPGNVGVVSRSGTLTYEIALNLTRKGLGQSTAVGIGGDPIIGTEFVEVLELFRNDENTKQVVIIGEIGGEAEEKAAKYVKETNYPKPVIGFIAGISAPPGKRMGHAGAIISMGTGDAESKVRSMRDAGIKVGYTPSEVAELATKGLASTAT